MLSNADILYRTYRLHNASESPCHKNRPSIRVDGTLFNKLLKLKLSRYNYCKGRLECYECIRELQTLARYFRYWLFWFTFWLRSHYVLNSNQKNNISDKHQRHRNILACHKSTPSDRLEFYAYSSLRQRARQLGRYQRAVVRSSGKCSPKTHSRTPLSANSQDCSEGNDWPPNLFMDSDAIARFRLGLACSRLMVCCLRSLCHLNNLLFLLSFPVKLYKTTFFCCWILKALKCWTFYHNQSYPRRITRLLRFRAFSL